MSRISLWLDTDFCLASGLAETKQKMERNLLETQLRGFPVLKNTGFSTPFPKEEYSRRMGWMWGTAASGEGKAESTSAEKKTQL